MLYNALDILSQKRLIFGQCLDFLMFCRGIETTPRKNQREHTIKEETKEDPRNPRSYFLLLQTFISLRVFHAYFFPVLGQVFEQMLGQKPIQKA